ncbi:ChrR family anti-sigma-E factor [Neorhizobium galegae]|uniref:ChrR family anti-sigma-E factor n=1 Tax=Neorhizobium galegae TaxID=399 RepID=UPI0006220B74|nr:ChrR family anti-sigma-E factor [Neorhizobium galegae]MCQ1764760.1 ChrR family anti-sigma-E factor [Neorhizobium galegae]MCQ1845620.1 ChrR family anti-sigma-E factor [Neorhizobium galegae]CDZ38948.1 Anti-sigma factor ChrR [Neorhizobium galegae bv. officinalis]
MLQNLERLDLLIAHYVSGSLPEPAHVLVGSHLEMQSSAAKLASLLEGYAGDALQETTPIALSDRERRLAEIFASAPPPEPRARMFEKSSFPASLRAYVGTDLADIGWKMKLPGLRHHVIEKSEDVETSLLWVRPGRAIPQHGHHGLELTLVLEGEFHDHRGNFRTGDVSVADETLDHRPVAGKRGPCLCFSVLFAPIALSGSTLRLFGDIIGL